MNAAQLKERLTRRDLLTLDELEECIKLLDNQIAYAKQKIAENWPASMHNRNVWKETAKLLLVQHEADRDDLVKRRNSK